MKKPISVNTDSKKEMDVLPLSQCLAKTVKLSNGKIVKGTNIISHCHTVGCIAKELIDRQPVWLQEALFPSGSELIAAAHDLGKVSPHFQAKIYSAAQEPLLIGNPALDSALGGHATISQACLSDAPEYIREIIGRHHGSSPSNVGLASDESYGGTSWQKLRMDLLEILKKSLKTDWPEIKDENQANVISGLVCVADWIGSSSVFDAYNLDGTPNATAWETKISNSIDNAGFVSFKVRPNLSFQDVFKFTPREPQIKLIESVNQPGVYILEAPMGMGKTEAALYAAYVALDKGFGTGIYFALPTQLTSNKIHDRMNSFLSNILDENCKFRALLLHSSAWLRDTEIGEEGMPGKGWFNSNKRGLLAPFAVGTIDQALMSVMNVRHGFVRTFGLAGKVVILDEVHSYDSFTGTILNKLVKSLQEINCTVIILSATLTSVKRAELIGEHYEKTNYPLVSALRKNAQTEIIPVSSVESIKVSLKIKNSNHEAIEEVILRAERGEQVLWIENTVAESQLIYTVLAARAEACGVGIDCGLIHSRFQRKDRAINEDKWVKKFGKDGHKERQKSGRILVGTQVLEQSLDIDADFLITRVCPSDMILQRIGRLWRHRETDHLRPKAAIPEAWILSPTIDSLNKQNAWGKSGKVYAPYVLYRTLQVWMTKDTLTLPLDIRNIIEDTYCERDEKDLFSLWKSSLISERKKLEGLARVGISSAGKTISDSKARTRYSDTETCEVLLIKKLSKNHSDTILTFASGETISLPRNAKKNGVNNWQKLAIKIHENVTLVPSYLAPKTSTHQIKWLEDFVYLGESEDSPFRIGIIKEGGGIMGIDSGRALDGYDLSYSNTTGYKALKKKNNNWENDDE